MPHRDDREALNAKLDAQARELAEAKEENERLRAANVRKATELERMRAHAPTDAALDPSETDDSENADAAAGDGQMPPVHPMHQPLAHHPLSPSIRRQLGGLMIATSLLVGGLSLSAVRLAGSGAHCHGGGCPTGRAGAYSTAVHATFPATIIESSGATSHLDGEPCVVDATFDADSRSQLHALSSLSVTCGGETLYAPIAGALDGAGLVWADEAPGSARYDIAVRDGSSATRLDIDSWDGRARLEGRDWVLDLDVSPLSDAVEMPLAIAAPAEAVVVRSGHVVDASGLALGTACTVARRPSGLGAYEHRVVVRCGGHTLYGAGQTGYTYPSRDPRLSLDEQVSSDDGDARMTLDLVQNEVHLEDGLGLVAQHVDIALD